MDLERAGFPGPFPSEILTVLTGAVLPLRELALTYVAALLLAAPLHRVKKRCFLSLFQVITSAITIPSLAAVHVTFLTAQLYRAALHTQ
jgi:hypothetical protein